MPCFEETGSVGVQECKRGGEGGVVVDEEGEVRRGFVGEVEGGGEGGVRSGGGGVDGIYCGLPAV